MRRTFTTRARRTASPLRIRIRSTQLCSPSSRRNDPSGHDRGALFVSQRYDGARDRVCTMGPVFERNMHIGKESVKEKRARPDIATRLMAAVNPNYQPMKVFATSPPF